MLLGLVKDTQMKSMRVKKYFFVFETHSCRKHKPIEFPLTSLSECARLLLGLVKYIILSSCHNTIANLQQSSSPTLRCGAPCVRQLPKWKTNRVASSHKQSSAPQTINTKHLEEKRCHLITLGLHNHFLTSHKMPLKCLPSFLSQRFPHVCISALLYSVVNYCQHCIGILQK